MTLPALAFAKYEGLGNDFLIVDALDAEAVGLNKELVSELCDRHRGVGADGVLVVGQKNGQPFMTIHNADGSEPEMCGNGLRCVALWAHAKKLVVGDVFVIDTPAGPHTCRLLNDSTLVEVQMREVSYDPKSLPLNASKPWLDESLVVSGQSFRATALSIGNPHVVIFDAVPKEAQRAVGEALGHDPRFPRGVNVNFAIVRDRGIELRVWERGVGFTEACGTGACATAAAAVTTGRLSNAHPIDVQLPGGVVSVRVRDEGEPVSMTGPARHVFSGSMKPEDRA